MFWEPRVRPGSPSGWSPGPSPWGCPPEKQAGTVDLAAGRAIVQRSRPVGRAPQGGSLSTRDPGRENVARIWLLRLACLAYGLFLSVLLLVPDPAALLGLSEVPGPPGGRMVHLAFFTVLGLLASSSRWPLRTRALLILLGGYAVGTELLQHFVPPRTVDPIDALENLVGLGLGTCLGGWLQRQRASEAVAPPTARSRPSLDSSSAGSGTLPPEPSAPAWPVSSVD